MKNDITGNVYDSLTVTGVFKSARKDKLWEVKCICGGTGWASSSDLKRGRRNFCQNCKEKNSMSSGVNIFYTSYKRAAILRGYDFNLTFEEFENLIFKNCSYCDIAPLNISKKTMRSVFKYNGIDRRDNSLGYNINNCVTCCKFCNIAKKDNKESDFTAWLDHVKSTNCK